MSTADTEILQDTPPRAAPVGGSAAMLISGKIFRTPQERTTNAGKRYVVATLACRDGAATDFWRVTAFDSTPPFIDLGRLREGDACACRGRLSVSIYRKGDEPRVALALVADQIMALVRPSKRKRS